MEYNLVEETWPAETDPDFWTKVHAMIARDVAAHEGHLKAWDVVLRIPIWGYVMTSLEMHYQAELRDYLTAHPDRLMAFRRGLTEPLRGHTPETQTFTQIPFMGVQSGVWAMKCAHHIMKIEEQWKRPIHSFSHIIEVGAGIGDLARVCRDMGFTGRYTILDMAPMLEISSRYLKGLDVEFVSPAAHRIIPEADSIGIGTWSVSEIPFPERERLLQTLDVQRWFIIFQAAVFQMNNTHWFAKHFEEYSGTTITEMRPMLWHPFQGGSHYLHAARF